MSSKVNNHEVSFWFGRLCEGQEGEGEKRKFIVPHAHGALSPVVARRLFKDEKFMPNSEKTLEIVASQLSRQRSKNRAPNNLHKRIEMVRAMSLRIDSKTFENDEFSTSRQYPIVSNQKHPSRVDTLRAEAKYTDPKNVDIHVLKFLRAFNNNQSL